MKSILTATLLFGIISVSTLSLPALAASLWESYSHEINKSTLEDDAEDAYELLLALKLVEDYFPYYYFSSGEQYYPCSFYFDNDADLENNHENYDARKGMWDEKYAYVHVVEDENYLAIQSGCTAHIMIGTCC